MTMRWAAALAFLACLSPARADPPQSMQEILTGSGWIEVVRVERVDGTEITTRVERALFRSSSEIGRLEKYALPESVVVGEGARMIKICDYSNCPAWVGIDRGGYYFFRWASSRSGNLAPGIAEDGIVESFDRIDGMLCFRARVMFIDRPYKWSHLEGSVAYADGRGMVWGKILGRPQKAIVSAGSGAGGWDAEALMLTIYGAKGTVSLAGGPVTRAEDGCFEADLAPAAPVVRTPEALAKALAGSAPGAVARGTIKRGARTASITIGVGDDGRLELASRFFDPDIRDHTEIDRDSGHLLLVAHAATTQDEYLIDTGTDLMPPLPGAGPLAAIAEALKRTPELTWDVRIRDRHLVEDLVGTVTVRR